MVHMCSCIHCLHSKALHNFCILERCNALCQGSIPFQKASKDDVEFCSTLTFQERFPQDPC